MNQLLQSWVWILNHPFQVLTWGVFIWCASSTIAGAIVAYVSWQDDLKHDRERVEAERIQMLAVAHRTPNPWREKAPQGFDQRVS